VFITVTANKNVIRQALRAHEVRRSDLQQRHFNVEIDIPALEGCGGKREVRPLVVNFSLKTAARFA